MPFYGGDPQRADPRMLMDRLMKQGYSRMQAAAIVGNMSRESSLISNNMNREEGAYGLLQWRGPRFAQLQQYAAQQGKPWTDPEVQADFMAHELRTTESKNAVGFNNAKTLDEATAALHPVIRYDRRIEGNLADRQIAARNVFGAANDPDAVPQAPAAPPGTAPQPAQAQPAVSRGTLAYADDYDRPIPKGIRGGISEGLGGIAAALVKRYRKQPQGVSEFQAQLSGRSAAPQQIPGAQSYVEPATGNQVVSGLPGRYEQGDLLNMGPPAAQEPVRFPGGQVPLPRERPGAANAYRSDHLDMGESVADLRMGALVDPSRYFDYG